MEDMGSWLPEPGSLGTIKKGPESGDRQGDPQRAVGRRRRLHTGMGIDSFTHIQDENNGVGGCLSGIRKSSQLDFIAE